MADNSRVQSIVVGKLRWQELDAAGPIQPQSENNKKCTPLLSSFSLHRPGSHVQGMVPPCQDESPHIKWCMQSRQSSTDMARHLSPVDSRFCQVDRQHDHRCPLGGIHFFSQGVSLAWDFPSRLGRLVTWTVGFRLRPSKLFTIPALRILMWKPCLRPVC